MSEDIEYEHRYTSDEKLKWFGYGEWVEEPDIAKFKHMGIKCMIVRVIEKEFSEIMFGGHLRGYVSIPADHPYYHKKYRDIGIDVHCGLTFGEFDDNWHWIGFDCGHSGDYVPSIEYMKKTNSRLIEFNEMFPVPKEFENLSLFNPVYRNMDFCIQECKSMVEQLVNIKNEGSK